ncbi:MAG TPA: SigB/SigF/SigG family RNA polymerase sigma factor [Solirubrobacteraceae bacterium]|jgi:RNA polymerase sigma-B factor|nr:SigB/SigF/SigG family RNA polymerase sigma factor [Solirubrobacteraceae bacterium]
MATLTETALAAQGRMVPVEATQQPLSMLTDAELFERMHRDRDQRARGALVERYLPLARRLVRRYQHTDEPVDDLVQVASIGLIKAVDRFDSSREVMFSSYAVPTILGELKRHFRDRTWSVRVPRDLQEMALKVDQTVTRLSLGRRRSPSVGEIARVVEASEEQVLEALEAMGAYRASSLDVPRSAREQDGESVSESLGAEDDAYEQAEQRATLQPLLARIGDRERTVLGLRFGEDLTQAEIGERIGVSQMQVSRLIRQALTRLRAGAAERRDDKA